MKYLSFFYGINVIVFLCLTGCSEAYTPETLIEDVIAGKSDNLIDQFWQGKHKLEENEFAEVVGLYSSTIQSASLKKVPFEEDFNFKRKDRYGYLFLDENDNVAYSITYKFVKAERDGPDLINFIDFRSTEGNLPCLKFPTRFPIKCVKFPLKFPHNPKTLSEEYPKQLHGYRFYHTEMINKSNLAAAGDSVRPIIAFNITNLKVANNLEAILEELSTRIRLEDYLLAVNENYGVPTLNMTYPKGRFPPEEVQKIMMSVELAVGEHVEPHNFNMGSVSFGRILTNEAGLMLIGGLGDEADSRLRM